MAAAPLSIYQFAGTLTDKSASLIFFCATGSVMFSLLIKRSLIVFIDSGLSSSSSIDWATRRILGVSIFFLSNTSHLLRAPEASIGITLYCNSRRFVFSKRTVASEPRGKADSPDNSRSTSANTSKDAVAVNPNSDICSCPSPLLCFGRT